MPIDWEIRCKYHRLSEDDIRNSHNKVDWTLICQYQKLSEEFIIEFQDKVDWWNISEHQKLSDNFILEFANKLNINIVLWCQQDLKLETKEYLQLLKG